jgi:hypothetical protein
MDEFPASDVKFIDGGDTHTMVLLNNGDLYGCGTGA